MSDADRETPVVPVISPSPPHGTAEQVTLWAPTGRRIVVVGANHRVASTSVRDRLLIEEHAMPAALQRLRAMGVDEAALITTCDRVEIVAAASEPDGLIQALLEFLGDQAGMTSVDVTGHTFSLVDSDAVRQVFRVAASLDSVVIGEPYVLGQVKASHRISGDGGMMGPTLEALFQDAYAVAKRIRTETGIARRPVSMAQAAVDVVRDLHGEPAKCSALFMGLSEMSAMIRDALAAAGMTRLAVTHPDAARAERLAMTWSCHAFPFDPVQDGLQHADIVVCALGRRQPAITARDLKVALRHRRNRPILLIDGALPGDVDAAADDQDGVFRYTLADLEERASAGRAEREECAGAAENLIADAVAQYIQGRAERAAVPLIAALRQRFETVRAEALRDGGGNAERATRLMASRLLHEPSQLLRTAAALAPDDLAVITSALQRVFALDAPNAPAFGEDPGSIQGPAAPPRGSDTTQG